MQSLVDLSLYFGQFLIRGKNTKTVHLFKVFVSELEKKYWTLTFDLTSVSENKT